MEFPILSRLTAFLCMALVATLLLAPGLFVWIFNLAPSVGAEVMARRAGMLFVIPAILLFGLSRMTFSLDVQRLVSKSMATFMLAIGLLGITEFALGRVGPGIFFPVICEAVLFWLWFKLSKAPTA